MEPSGEVCNTKTRASSRHLAHDRSYGKVRETAPAVWLFMWLLHVPDEVHMQSRQAHGPAHGVLGQHELAGAGVNHLKHKRSFECAGVC